HEPAKRCDAGLGLTAPHDVAAADIPGRQILPGAAAPVLRFHPRRLAGPARQRRMEAGPRLDAGFLIRAEDMVLGPQRLALPGARVQVQDRPGLVDEAGITPENPVRVLPRLDGILIQDAPDATPADRFA